MEKTLVLVKPDAFKAGHTGDIIKIYEDAGLRLLAVRMMKMTKEVAAKHYEEHIGRPYYAELERTLLEEINALGIGPQGFGGRTTALAVNIEWMPTHIAGLPVAVNINCHVTRHKTVVL